jgi:hypothetical protein
VWLISDGLNTGVAALIGNALRQQTQAARADAPAIVLAVTPWPTVRRSQALINTSIYVRR